MEMSVKARMCDHGTSCWMVRYIFFADTINYSRFSVKMRWNYGEMYQNHVNPFLL